MNTQSHRGFRFHYKLHPSLRSTKVQNATICLTSTVIQPSAYASPSRNTNSFYAAMSSPKDITPASTAIPFVYRFILTVIEPLFALNGAIMVFRSPDEYLSTMTRHGGSFTPDSTFLYTALGGGWLYFTFIEVVVMRIYDDLRLWRLLCIGMLLSDAAFFHSTAQAVGGWAQWVDVISWTPEDHFIFWSNALVLVVRVLIIFGIGVKTGNRNHKIE